MPMLNMRFVLPDHVIDLNLVEGMAGIKEAGGSLEIGAMTRQRDLEFSDLMKAEVSLLHQAIMHIGHRQTRHLGTRRLAPPSPSGGGLVSVWLAHDAMVTVAGPDGIREIAFADFPAGYLTPAIELNEIVTAIRIPLWPAGHKAAFVEFSRRHGDFAIVARTGATATPPTRDRGAGDLAAVDLQQRRRRHDGEIAVAAGELDERRLVAGRPERNADRGDDLVQLDRRREIARGKSANAISRAPFGPATITVASCAAQPTPARPPDRDGRASRRWCRGCGSGGGRCA